MIKRNTKSESKVQPSTSKDPILLGSKSRIILKGIPNFPKSWLNFSNRTNRKKYSLYKKRAGLAPVSPTKIKRDIKDYKVFKN